MSCMVGQAQAIDSSGLCGSAPGHHFLDILSKLHCGATLLVSGAVDEAAFLGKMIVERCVS